MAKSEIKKTDKFYSLDRIKSTNCEWNLIYGMRSNGKSYAIKKEVLEDFRDNGHQLIYLRRYDMETKPSEVVGYFRDMCVPNKFGKVAIKEIFGEKAKTIDMRRKEIRLLFDDEEVEPVVLGYAVPLSGQSHECGQAYPLVGNIIYEEFISRDSGMIAYLKNEPSKLMDFVSTVSRDRNIKVYLLGNTISRFCPYFSEWELTKTPSQKAGEIVVYHINSGRTDDDGNPIVINLAVEHTEVMKTKNKMMFGHSTSMITEGGWQSEVKPHLENKLEDYTVLHLFVLDVSSYKFLCRYLWDKSTNNVFWYVERKTTDIKEATRIVSNKYTNSPLWTPTLSGLSHDEEVAFRSIKLGKVVYSDNLTGTEFKQALGQLGVM